jgi:hypothetical protein
LVWLRVLGVCIYIIFFYFAFVAFIL